MIPTAPPSLGVLLVACWLTPQCFGVSPSDSSAPLPYAARSVDHVDRYSGFTEPVREIKVSVSESGPVASVSAKRGMKVTPGQLLLTLDTKVLEANREVAEAKTRSTSRIEALVIESDVRKKRHEKLKQLYDDGAGSIEEVRRSEADASVAALEVDAARDELKLRKLELAEIEARIEQRKVRSPIAGVVTEVIKESGEFVSLQDPQVATVVQLDQLRVTFFIPTIVAASIHSTAVLDLLLPETNTRCSGKVEYIGVVTESDSGRVRLDVLIENQDRAYRSGVRCQWLPSTPSHRSSPPASKIGGNSR